MKRLFLSPPHLFGDEQALIDQAFASGYIAPCGPMVDRFEAAIAACAQTPGAVAASSGTAALQLIYRCIGIEPGDVVIASDLTFIASVAPAAQMGAKVVFVDSDPETWTMSPALLEQALAENPRAKLVAATDLYGQCCRYEALQALCDNASVPLVIDAAEALGATRRGRPAGSAGLAAAYSFNGNKIITTSGGGALVSHSPGLLDHARRLATQARGAALWYEHSETGYNHRLSNILGALGLAQIGRLQEAVARKHAVFARYAALLAGTAWELMPADPGGVPNRWLTVVTHRADRQAAPARPAEPSPRILDLLSRFEAAAIETRPVWKPMHLQPVFSGAPCYGGAVGEALFHSGLCLPSGLAVTPEEQQRVAAILKGSQ